MTKILGIDASVVIDEDDIGRVIFQLVSARKSHMRGALHLMHAAFPFTTYDVRLDADNIEYDDEGRVVGWNRHIQLRDSTWESDDDPTKLRKLHKSMKKYWKHLTPLHNEEYMGCKPCHIDKHLSFDGDAEKWCGSAYNITVHMMPFSKKRKLQEA
jgi:hypothetical protein